MADKHSKKYLMPIIMREMKTKTTIRFHLILLGMAKIKTSRNSAD